MPLNEPDLPISLSCLRVPNPSRFSPTSASSPSTSKWPTSTAPAEAGFCISRSLVPAGNGSQGPASTDLTGLAPIRKVDPKYPPDLIDQNVEGEVILYAVIRADGSVDSIQVVRSVDPVLDANAKSAFGQWKFRPAMKDGAPVALEAIVHVPFHIADNR